MTDERCFIAMPVATRKEHEETYGDAEHWKHVMDTIFVPAIEAAGMTAVPPSADGSEMIHGRIIENLSECAMVLCDLSSHNPNVFFELGVRTSMNLPVALVKDERTSIPFDTSGINTWQYASTLNAWDISGEVKALTEFLKRSLETCAGQNPLWRHFGLTIRANEPSSDESPTDARIDLLTAKVEEMQKHLPWVSNEAKARQWEIDGPDLDEKIPARKVRQERFLMELFAISDLSSHIRKVTPGDYHVDIEIISPFPAELHEQIVRLSRRHRVTVVFT